MLQDPDHGTNGGTEIPILHGFVRYSFGRKVAGTT